MYVGLKILELFFIDEFVGDNQMSEQFIKFMGEGMVMGSIIGIVTAYGLDGPVIEFWWG